MRIAPPPDNLPDAKRDAAQALYALVMNVAEIVHGGSMPARGQENLTYLGCVNIVDTLLHAMKVSDESQG